MIFTYHGLFFGLGAVVTALVYDKLLTKSRLQLAAASSFDVLIIFLAGLVGARLAYAIVFGVSSWWAAVAFWQVGMISWGGILGGLLAAGRLYAGRTAKSRWFDVLILAAIPGWIVGRLGNFFQQDAFGMVSEWWSAFYGRVPVPLLEIVGLFIIWLVGLWLIRLSWSSLKGGLQPGTTSLVIIALYALVRLVVDQYRELPELWLGLNLGQLTAIVVICVIIPIWIIRKKHI